MAKTPKSKANTINAPKPNGGKAKRAVIKDLQPTTKAGQKVVGGNTRLGTRCI